MKIGIFYNPQHPDDTGNQPHNHSHRNYMLIPLFLLHTQVNSTPSIRDEMTTPDTSIGHQRLADTRVELPTVSRHMTAVVVLTPRLREH